MGNAQRKICNRRNPDASKHEKTCYLSSTEREVRMVCHILQYKLQRLKGNDRNQCWQEHQEAGVP